MQSANCVENTGGTCAVENCAAWRGNTTCSVGRCFCAPGTCAGADGQCYRQANREIAHGFRLRNARWPDQYMYVSVFGGLAVSTSLNNQSMFNLWETPGQGANASEFLLQSEGWPNYVATIAKEQFCTGNGPSGGQSCTTETVGATAAVQLVTSSSVEKLTVRLVSAPTYLGAPNNTQSLMISSFTYPGWFLYLSSYSWSVQAFLGDPGVGGYWIADPPLPLELPAYTGPRCSWYCGSYGSGFGVRPNETGTTDGEGHAGDLKGAILGIAFIIFLTIVLVVFFLALWRYKQGSSVF